MTEHADRHKRKQQRNTDVKRPERRHQHSIQWRQPTSKHGRLQGRRTCLAVQRQRLHEAIADQRAQEQQHRPQGPAAEDVPQLLHEERPEGRVPDHRCLR